MYKITYSFPGDAHRLIELEYFCRGGVAMNSDNLDWMSDDVHVTILSNVMGFIIFLVNIFGEPDSITNQTGKSLSFIELCSTHTP